MISKQETVPDSKIGTKVKRRKKCLRGKIGALGCGLCFHGDGGGVNQRWGKHHCMCSTVSQHVRSGYCNSYHVMTLEFSCHLYWHTQSVPVTEISNFSSDATYHPNDTIFTTVYLCISSRSIIKNGLIHAIIYTTFKRIELESPGRSGF